MASAKRSENLCGHRAPMHKPYAPLGSMESVLNLNMKHPRRPKKQEEKVNTVEAGNNRKLRFERKFNEEKSTLVKEKEDFGNELKRVLQDTFDVLMRAKAGNSVLDSLCSKSPLEVAVFTGSRDLPSSSQISYRDSIPSLTRPNVNVLLRGGTLRSIKSGESGVKRKEKSLLEKLQVFERTTGVESGPSLEHVEEIEEEEGKGKEEEPGGFFLTQQRSEDCASSPQNMQLQLLSKKERRNLPHYVLCFPRSVQETSLKTPQTRKPTITARLGEKKEVHQQKAAVYSGIGERKQQEVKGIVADFASFSTQSKVRLRNHIALREFHQADDFRRKFIALDLALSRRKPSTEIRAIASRIENVQRMHNLENSPWLKIIPARSHSAAKLLAVLRELISQGHSLSKELFFEILPCVFHARDFEEKDLQTTVQSIAMSVFSVPARELVEYYERESLPVPSALREESERKKLETSRRAKILGGIRAAGTAMKWRRRSKLAKS